MKRDWTDLAIAAAASVAAVVFLHWAGTHPALLGVRELRGPFFVEVLLAAPGNRMPLPEWFRQAHLAIIASLGLGAAALSLFIVFKSGLTSATRRLAAALALAPVSAACFYFLWTHAVYRNLLMLGEQAWHGHALNFVGYASGLASAVLLVRFFIGYPRQPALEEMAAFRVRVQEEAIASARSGWRGRMFGPLTRYSDALKVKHPSLGRPLSGGAVPFEMAQWRFFASAWPLLLVAVLAVLATVVDAHVGALEPGRDPRGIRPLVFVPFLLNMVLIVFAITTAYLALVYHHREAIADDRARIDWIYGTVLVVGVLALAVPIAAWAVMAVVFRVFEPGAISPDALLIGPAAFAFEFFLAAFLASLALSIFYRGAVDPRLALSRVTVFGVMGLVVAVLFVILERAVAIKIAGWLGMPAETSALVAAGLVAGTLAPVRKSAEKGLMGLVSRFLPLETVVQGDRKTVAVVLSDLSGYTALSARDEKQAMLAAALLQRLAAKAAEDFRGRVVKSMGDAVILVFDEAGNAGHAMDAMHERFAPGASALGIPVLPVHSGAHYGEVTQTHDGDIYGQTVNIAARLQSVARAGQKVVSADFARAAMLAEGKTRSLGLQALKNVPEPVECLEIAAAVAPPA